MSSVKRSTTPTGTMSPMQELAQTISGGRPRGPATAARQETSSSKLLKSSVRVRTSVYT